MPSARATADGFGADSSRASRHHVADEIESGIPPHVVNWSMVRVGPLRGDGGQDGGIGAA